MQQNYDNLLILEQSGQAKRKFSRQLKNSAILHFSPLFLQIKFFTHFSAKKNEFI